MSKQVDERIVSMQFDNRNFEKNVSTTMSTLDKLKAKLNLSGAAKGLENVESAARKIDMSPLGKGIETVRTKFSALEVMGVTALANITNSAVNAGKRIVESLTITPITTGFNEYELKMNSVQTIMASTGKDLKIVNKYLDELNEYSDKTIYSFQDMTQNIGKFTNAGVDLKDAVLAMKGISNEAAVSGANANEASRAMYNFAQALSVGYIQRIDWKSIELANMATVEFKDQLLQSAMAAGTVKKNAKGMYTTLAHPDKALSAAAMFTEALSDQWLTSEVLIDTLKDYADEETAIGKKATKAATEVKTFSQMLDTLKESAQSGWAKTWELIFGDFNEGKNLWTSLNNVISGFLDKISNFRNAILESALGKNFTKLSEQISTIAKPAAKAAKSVKTITKAAKDYSKVVDEIIKGDWGNGQSRWDKLTKSGYDWAKAQNLVNEKLGCTKRYTENVTDSQKKLNKTTEESVKVDAKFIAKHAEMSDAQLKSLGYTDDQIKAFRDLAEAADRVGMPLEEFIEHIDEIDGRWLVLDSFKNIWEEISKVFDTIGKAWKNVFGESTIEDKAEGLYGIIEYFHKLTESLEISEASAENFQNVMEGLFSLFQLTGSIASMSIVGGLKILNALLELFGTNILGVAGKLGEMITKFNNWVKDNTLFGYGTQWQKIAEILKAVIDGVTKCAKAFWALKPVKDIVSNIAKALGGLFGGIDFKSFKFDVDTVVKAINKFFDNVENWIKSLNDSENIGLDIVKGIAKGLGMGAKWAFDAIVKLGTTIIETFKTLFGIHSPSRVFMTLGGFIITGLILGLKSQGKDVGGFFKDMLADIGVFIMDFGSKVFEYVKKIQIGDMIAMAITAGIGLAVAKTLKILNNFSEGVKGFGKMCSGVGNLANAFAEKINPKKNKFKEACNAILQLAIAIGILAASVWLLAQLEVGQLWIAVGALATLAIVVGVLAFAASKLDTKDGSFAKLSLALIGIAASLYIMGSAIKKLEFLDKYNVGPILLGFGAMIAGLTFILVMFGKFVKGKAAQNIDKAGWTILKISAALLLMTFVVKQIAKLDENALKKGGIFIVSFSALCVGLVALTKLAGKKIDSVGKMLLSIAGAMLLMVVVIKLISRMEPGELVKGITVIALFGGIMVGLVAMTKLVGGKSKSIAAIGKTILAMSAAMLLMAVTIRILAGLDAAGITKGLICITAFAGIITGLIAATKLAGKNLKSIAITMIAIAGAIALIGVTAMILSLMSIEGLVKGITAVGLLSLMMIGLIRATEKAKNAKGSLIALTVAIGVLGGLLIGLSFIDPVRLAAATGALSLVIGMFAALLYAMQYLKTGEKTFKRNLATIGVLTLVVAALAGVIVGMSKLEPTNVIQNATALSIVMLGLTAVAAALSTFKGNTKGIVKGALGMSALVGVMALVALVLAMMTAMNVQASMANVIAVSTLMLVLAGIAAVMSIFGSLGTNILMGALGMAALAGVMALVGLVLAMIQAMNVQASMDNVLALSTLMLVLTGVAAVMAIFGGLGTNILMGALGMTALVGVMALVGLVLAMMSALKVDNAMENAKALSLLLMTMAGVCAVLALVGPAALLGIPALYALTQFILVFGALSVAIGYLMEMCPQLETFLDKGIDIFVRLAAGLGEMIGAFIGGIVEGVVTCLPPLGKALSDFMMNAQFFILGAKMVDDAVLKGVGILVAAIGALLVADMINSITTFGGLQGSFASLGTELSNFMKNAKVFIEGSSSIKPEIMTGMKALAEAILILTGSNLLDTCVKIFNGGDSSMDMFARQMPLMGKGINGFITELGTLTDDQVSIAGRAAKIIKILAEAASEIPNTGGLLGDLVGNNDLGPWAAQLPILATGIKGFITTLTSDVKLTDDGVKIAEKAANIIKVLAEAAKEIPNAGGFLASWIGDNDLSKWAEQLPVVGEGIKGFITTLTSSGKGASCTFGEEQAQIANQAAKVVKTLAEAAKEIPNAGGYLASWIGDNDLSTWAKELPNLGKGVKGFADELGTFDEDKLATVKAATKAVKIISTMAKDSAEINISGNVTAFGKSMKKIAGHIVDFVETMKTVTGDRIDNEVGKVEKLIKLAQKVAKTNVESVSTFGKSLKTVAKDGVKGFVNALKGEKPVSDVKAAAKTLLDEFIDAAKKKKSDINKAFEGIAGAAAKSIKTSDMKDKFKSAGKYCVEGFANGIKDNKSLASDAGTSLGKAALKAAKAALREKSPSKAMYEVGAYAVDGFVNALNAGVGSAYSAGGEMADGARKGLSGAISKITDLLDGDLDAQPTITPVLDLSNVKSGASAIGGMLSGRRTLAIDTANIGAVSALMSGNQNGRNSTDVVSAIKGLRKDIANMPRNTYSIGGITYGEGTEVADAINTLVRAAKMERRN